MIGSRSVNLKEKILRNELSLTWGWAEILRMGPTYLESITTEAHATSPSS